ncbi:MAG: GDSL-type esterase/lipase family protein [Candidatus Symbiothrix sp.]|jgi:lysophospholipase L1-like esterase|nr:GDSL-type esterase/lipase family protein [Candidatus Symbiothrix sp.]
MKVKHILWFMCCVLSLLGVICLAFPRDGMTVMGKQLFFPSLAEVFSSDSTEHGDSVLKKVDALEETMHIDPEEEKFIRFFCDHPSRIQLPDDNFSYFDALFADLEKAADKRKTIHVLHYGDSQIESDRITAVIRQKLQDRFGGSGPGLLPAVQAIASATVSQSASENIERFIVSGTLKNKAQHNRYGATGQVGVSSGDNYLSVRTDRLKNNYTHLKNFRQIRLFVGKAGKNFRAQLTAGKTKLDTDTETVNSTLKIYTWTASEPISKFSIHTSGAGELYGIAVDSLGGVAMDNLPFRGSSGTFFRELNSDLLSAMYQALNVRLILLEFGGNSVPYLHTEKQINTYAANIGEQIAYLQKLQPNAKIVLIGPADMSKRVQGKLQSYPCLEQLIPALQQTALAHGAAFWNMYEVMGGHNSMLEWVKTSPKLAAADYVHFTNKGADKIGNLFAESFLLYYDYYQFRKNKK